MLNQAATHPAIVLVMIWALVALIGRAWPGRRPANALRPLLLVSAAAVVASFAAIVIWYVTRAAYFDPAEPTIGAVAFVFGKGKPLYPALADPERYAHVYGPVLFAVQWAAFALAGPSILVSKAVGAIAILASLAIGFAAFARKGGPAAALAGTGLCALIYLGFANATFWSRADPLLILLTTLALWVDARVDRARALLVMGAIAGLAVNLKITGPAYLLPLIVAGARPRARVALGAASVAALVAALPFVLPNVSLAHYVEYIRLSARNGLLALRFEQNIEVAVFLGLPAGFVWWRGSAVGGRPRLFAAALAGAVLAVIVAGAKPGGGPVHLLPFVPIGVALIVEAPQIVRGSPAVRALLAACVVVALVRAVERQTVFIPTVAARPLEPVVDDLRVFASAHPGERIAVGYAGTSYVSYARPAIVFATGDYLLDAPAVQEYRLSNAEVLEPTMRAIEQCAVRYWLVPRDGEPFRVPNAYAPLGPAEVFPPEFRARFRQHHSKVSSTKFFDVWECR